VKYCMLARIEDGQVGDILEMSLVSDDHEFGLSPDGKLMHIGVDNPVTVSRGRFYENGPVQPTTINGVPVGSLFVKADNTGCVLGPGEESGRDG
jgi:hypothetical protein